MIEPAGALSRTHLPLRLSTCRAFDRGGRKQREQVDVFVAEQSASAACLVSCVHGRVVVQSQAQVRTLELLVEQVGVAPE